MQEQALAYREMVYQELADLSSNPTVTMDEIKDKLSAIWHHAGDKGDAEMQAVALETWNKVESLNKVTDTAIVLLAAAKQLADETAMQRDSAVKLYDGLKDAVIKADTKHPLVAGLHESLSESAYEEALEQAQDDLVETWDSGYDFWSRLAVDSEVIDMPTAVLFWQYIGGEAELTEDEENELTHFIQTWTAKVKARQDDLLEAWKAEIEKRTKAS